MRIEDHPVRDHEQFVRFNIKRILSKSRRGGYKAATDAECIAHLTGMVRKHGRNVLEPFEQRLLSRLEKAA